MSDTITKQCSLCETVFDGLNDGGKYCDLCNQILELESKDKLCILIRAIIETKENRCENSGWNWLDDLKYEVSLLK